MAGVHSLTGLLMLLALAQADETVEPMMSVVLFGGGTNKVAVWPACPSVTIPDISWKFNRGADAVVYGDEIIMCGGDNSLDFYGDSGKAEPGCHILSAEHEWREGAPMSEARTQHTLTVVGDKIVAIGGITRNRVVLSRSFLFEDEYVDSIEVYEDGQWSRKVGWKLEPVRKKHCAVAISDEEVVILGGFADGYLTQVQKLNILTGVWMDLPPLESGRREHACTLYKDGILVTGSSPEEGFLDSQIRMEFLNLTSMQWEKDVVPSLNKHVLTPKMETINGRLTVLGLSYEAEDVSSTGFFCPSFCYGYLGYGRRRRSAVCPSYCYAVNMGRRKRGAPGSNQGSFKPHVEIYHEESNEWKEESWEGEGKVDFAMTPVRCNCISWSGTDSQLELGESRIRLYMEPKRKWKDAQSDCLARGGMLATIRDEAESAAIKTFTDSICSFGSAVIWTGANVAINSDAAATTDGGADWRWATGEKLTYANWREGLPDGRWRGEDCAERSADGLWNDVNCEAERPYICRFEGGVREEELAGIGENEVAGKGVPGRHVIALLMKTGNGVDDDVDADGQIDLTLMGTKSGPLCVIYNLDAENFDDFESGKVDAFKGQEIQYCNNKFVSESLSMVKIKHTGSDSWGVDWIKVLYSDGTQQECSEGATKVLSNQEAELLCKS